MSKILFDLERMQLLKEIERLCRLIDRADDLLSAVIYDDDPDITECIPPFDRKVALAWTEEASKLTPITKQFYFPKEEPTDGETVR